VPKGFIAVDGTSLTVVDVDEGEEGSAAAAAGGAGAGAPAAAAPARRDGSFTFMLIAHTQSHIIIPRKRIGDRVNLEVDVLGKHAERAAARAAERAAAVTAAAFANLTSRIEDALRGVAGRLEGLEARVAALERR
jgi:riboflavin synthase